VTPPQNYLTLSLRALGFNTTQSNLLTIPSIVLGTINLLIFCYMSEYVDSRIGSLLTLQIWALPLLIALYTFTPATSNWVVFAVVTLITGFPYVHPVQVAWASTNSYSVGARTVSASIYNMFVQAGGIVAVRCSLLIVPNKTLKLIIRRRQIFIVMMTSHSVSLNCRTQTL
jgi:hypothetical protein